MKLLLTGATGFVGTYFINNYKNIYNIENFSFLRDDLKSLDLSDFHTVIHLSALVHQMNGAPYEEYYRVNVKQTLDLAKKAKESGVKQFVFMSSVKVYGEENNSPYTSITPCSPEDDYGKSKLEAENELRTLEDESFSVAIVRTPVVYGYGVKANIKNLVSLVQKVPLLPFGNIQNRRSMIYVGNLCFIIDDIIKEKKRGLFLVADREVLSTTQLVRYIAMALDKKVYLLSLPFFASLLRIVKPSFYKRLFESLEIKSNYDIKLPYKTVDGILYMIKGEK